MARYQDTVWCDNCGSEITWVPIAIGKNHYCCQECRDGYRCDCPELMTIEEDRRVPLELSIDKRVLRYSQD